MTTSGNIATSISGFSPLLKRNSIYEEAVPFNLCSWNQDNSKWFSLLNFVYKKLKKSQGTCLEIVPTKNHFLATQNWLDPVYGGLDPFKKYNFDESLPVTVRISNQDIILDGHHRISNSLVNKQPIKIRRFELDESLDLEHDSKEIIDFRWEHHKHQTVKEKFKIKNFEVYKCLGPSGDSIMYFLCDKDQAVAYYCISNIKQSKGLKLDGVCFVMSAVKPLYQRQGISSAFYLWVLSKYKKITAFSDDLSKSGKMIYRSLIGHTIVSVDGEEIKNQIQFDEKISNFQIIELTLKLKQIT